MVKIYIYSKYLIAQSEYNTFRFPHRHYFVEFSLHVDIAPRSFFDNHHKSLETSWGRIAPFIAAVNGSVPCIFSACRFQHPSPPDGPRYVVVALVDASSRNCRQAGALSVYQQPTIGRPVVRPPKVGGHVQRPRHTSSRDITGKILLPRLTNGISIGDMIWSNQRMSIVYVADISGHVKSFKFPFIDFQNGPCFASIYRRTEITSELGLYTLSLVAKLSLNNCHTFNSLPMALRIVCMLCQSDGVSQGGLTAPYITSLVYL